MSLTKDIHLANQRRAASPETAHLLLANAVWGEVRRPLPAKPRRAIGSKVLGGCVKNIPLEKNGGSWAARNPDARTTRADLGEQSVARPTRLQKYWVFWVGLVLMAIVTGSAPAQEDLSRPILSQAELQSLAAESSARPATGEPSSKPGLGGMSFLRLLVDGGALMIPIGLMSLLVVAVALERWIVLRRGRLFPRKLRRELRLAIEEESEVNPPELFRAAEHFPSVASTVMMELLGKVGRPMPEIESTLSEAVQRQADRLYGNVRWLTLAAAVTPLIGLLGTVWGMIIAFYNTTQLASGMNRAEYLAEGIYVALVTTLAGLAVAIPAAIFAHYFEGRITKNLGAIDIEMRRLLPRLETFEGKTRFDITARGLQQRSIPRGTIQPSAAQPTAGEATAPVLRGPKLKL